MGISRCPLQLKTRWTLDAHSLYSALDRAWFEIYTEERLLGQRIKQDSWVWVIVQDPSGNPHFVGQQDEQTQLKFIPVFLDKETALKNINTVAREKGHKYEVQAIIFEELAQDAAANGFEIFLLDEESKVLEHIVI